MVQEIWKDIIGYEGKYQISNLWIVKSLHYHRTGGERIMKLWKHSDWYLTIRLRYGKCKLFLVHRLVAFAYIPNHGNKSEVNHINWIKTDNRVDNLEWCTREENMNHAFEILWTSTKWRFWKDSYSSKKILQIYEGNIVKIWWSIIDAEISLWLSHWNITRVCKWKRITTWWFKWEYSSMRL